MELSDLALSLVRAGLLSQADATSAERRARMYGGGLDTVLLETGVFDEAALAPHLTEATGLPTVPATKLAAAGPALASIVDAETALRLGAAPFASSAGIAEMAVRPQAHLPAIAAWARERDVAADLFVVPEVRFRAVLAAVYAWPPSARFLALLGKLDGQAGARRRGPPGAIPPPLVDTGPRPRPDRRADEGEEADAPAPWRPEPMAERPATAAVAPRPPGRPSPVGPSFADKLVELLGPDGDPGDPEARQVGGSAPPSGGESRSALPVTGEGGVASAAAVASPHPHPLPAAREDGPGRGGGPGVGGVRPAAPGEGPGLGGVGPAARGGGPGAAGPGGATGGHRGRAAGAAAQEPRDARAYGGPGAGEEADLCRERARSEQAETARAAFLEIVERRDVEAIPTLIDRLAEMDGEIAASARAALVALTAQDFGTTARRWRGWWRKARDRARIDWLFDALAHPRPELRLLAEDELLTLTGRYVGYHFDLPARDRNEARRRWIAWWRERAAGPA